MKNLGWLLLSLIIFIIDQYTKHYVVTQFNYQEALRVLPVLNFTLTYNPGAAFNFLSSEGGWQRWLFMLIAVGVSIYFLIVLLQASAKDYLTKIGVALIIGGALGNLFDRIHYGYVIDFIQVHYAGWYFPDFNVADSAITVGAVCIILKLLGSKLGDR